MGKILKLGLFGFGCVGQGLYHVLHETRGIKAEIKKICIKHPEKKRSLPDSFFTLDKAVILHDPEIDVVVELIDDADAAFAILKEALQNGKHVVTANKKMLAENLEEVYHLQQQYGRSVLYEGAVCGSIPIIRNLEEYYDNDLITEVCGIFNGSTNYILSKIFNEEKSYAEALAEAQQLGFAESDPTLDVAGFDPKYKLAIVLAHAFGVFVKPDDITNIGIDRISADDLDYARENKLAVKLVACAFKTDNAIHALVAPQFVENDNSLRHIQNEYNAVQVRGAFSEKQLFIGKGAGGYPTGSAVLSDISALRYGYRYEYRKLQQHSDVRFSNDIAVRTFVRLPAEQGIPLNNFQEVESGYAGAHSQYLCGRLPFNKLKTWSSDSRVGFILAPEPDFVPALATVNANTLLVA
ncbi:MAG: homoserine dehydrogenase [Cyclobacteriaceae bacterium]|nr:homoserine dehydrogenase [Cyclobacteriaceae bacterium]QOI97116.1 MAG: homoserine dehydrogenase [Flammeovirgaceae bacterium]